jgi:hypothetical protein
MAGIRAKRPCGNGQCPVLISHPARYCEKHAAKESKRQYDAKRSDEVWLLYQTPRWKKFRAWFLRMNVICQRVIDGKQCMNWATLVHHRRGLRSHPEDLCDADHCAALCAEHHHPGDGDLGDEVYVPTITD